MCLLLKSRMCTDALETISILFPAPEPSLTDCSPVTRALDTATLSAQDLIYQKGCAAELLQSPPALLAQVHLRCFLMLHMSL